MGNRDEEKLIRISERYNILISLLQYHLAQGKGLVMDEMITLLAVLEEDIPERNYNT